MKDQASLNLLIVDSPIDNKALTGHLMLRATPTGLKVCDATGSESELGGNTSALEGRVATLETTVGALDTAVDEILADYGEGSGALVYRVVASATEPKNPTEGMIWIETT
nr:MAG TPA: hypothetical protein [Bacteriophage sp.]